MGVWQAASRVARSGHGGFGWLIACIATAFAAASAAAQPGGIARPAPETPLSIVVSVPPLKGLVEPLAPAGSKIQMLVPPGRSEHSYELTPGDLATVARADVVVYVGLNLEPKLVQELERRPRQARQVVEFAAAAGVTGEGGCDHPDHDHAHDHDGHDHGPVDQHLWLDPALVEKLIPQVAAAIEAALREKNAWDAAAAERLRDAQHELIDQVRGVDAAYRDRLGSIKGKAIVTHHNAFGRVAERYGFTVATAIRSFEGAEPTPGELSKVVDAIREQGVTIIYIEPQYNPAMAQRIARLAGVEIGTLDPLGDGDWFRMMRANLDALARDGAGR